MLGPYIPVELTLRVERTIKGTTSSPLRFFDAASVGPGGDGSPLRHPDGSLWFAGGSGACGILDEDVTGSYGLFILTHREDGSLRPNRLLTAWGDGPDSQWVARLRQQVAALSPPATLPSTGASIPLPAALSLAGGFALLAGLALRRI